MNKKLLITGSVLGIIAITLGAFAAHGLEKLIDEKAIQSFETGVRYQMYHAFFLLILGVTSFIKEKAKYDILILVSIGVVFFSFSIYALATNSLSTFDFKTIAFITPIGGLLLILAWVLLLINILKTKN
ncbi:MAG: DUF423 domain-containing protein [Winogradskyella sp.]|nr:MAG: DUF423 domain-containing protein [Winogradskyella sp.]